MRVLGLLFLGALGAACGSNIEDAANSTGGSVQNICCNCPTPSSSSGSVFGGTSVSASSGGGPVIVDCSYSYSHCDDGYTYGFHCTGPMGNYTCHCTYNGPEGKQFSSTTMCDFTSARARIEALNAACGFSLSTDSRGSGQYSQSS